MAEPNVLLLDRAQWKLNGGEWQAEEDILRIDNHIRALLGYPRRQDAFIQPWRVREAPEKDVVMLRIKMESRVETGSLMLALERPEKNRNPLERYFLSDVKTGGNRLVYGYFYTDGVCSPDLRRVRMNCFGSPLRTEDRSGEPVPPGEFGVCVQGTKSLVTAAPTELAFGDITDRDCPFMAAA